MLMEYFFEAVERAFRSAATKIPVSSLKERKRVLEFPLPVSDTSWVERRLVSERRHLPDRRLPRV
jgi:hypothetical protein